MKKMLAALVLFAIVAPAMAADNTATKITLSGSIDKYVALSPNEASASFGDLGGATATGYQNSGFVTIGFDGNCAFSIQCTVTNLSLTDVPNVSNTLETKADVVVKDKNNNEVYNTNGWWTGPMGGSIAMPPFVAGHYVGTVKFGALRNGINDPAGAYTGEVAFTITAQN